MKIEKETVQKLLVKDVQGLDPVSIYLEDIGKGQGKVTITCFGESWTSYWGGMGNRTVAEFVRSCDNQYLAKNLSRIPCEIDDLTKLHQDMLKTILSKRKALEINGEEARECFDGIKDSDPEEIMTQHEFLSLCYGDEWWYCVPKKPNPDYEYLCRIITTVKEALKEVA
jgi:hypothetical protein